MRKFKNLKTRTKLIDKKAPIAGIATIIGPVYILILNPKLTLSITLPK